MMSIKRLFYKYIIGTLNPVKYAQKIGVNMRGGGTYLWTCIVE